VTTFGRLIAAALGLALLASPSLARDMRHPASGEPAISVSFPDNWTANTVDNGSTLSVVDPDHRIGFSLTVAPAHGDTIDDIARHLLQGTNGTLNGKQKVLLSGYAGETYTWSYMNAHRIKLNVTTTMVMVGDKVASCSKMEVDTNAPAYREVAETVMQSIKIVPPVAGK
jgi:hypothetical protein